MPAHLGGICFRLIVIPQQVKYSMYYQQIQFIFKCMPLLGSLPLSRINGDDYIAKGNPLCLRLRLLALDLAEGQDVRRTIRPSILSIQLLDMLIVRKDNTYFGRFGELLNLQRLPCGPYEPSLVHRSRLAIPY